jgi:hypothetical protein
VAGGVYSERFVYNRAAGTVTYVVPPGRRAVVKCVSSYNNDASTRFVTIDLAGTTVWRASVPGGQGVFGAGLMIVAYEGEGLALTNEVAGQRSALSGYLLQL